MEEEANRLSRKELHHPDKDKVARLIKVMKFYDLNRCEMAERLGIHQSNLSKILLGRRAIGKSIDAKFLLACPEINKTWYLSGEGEMLNEGYTSFNAVAAGPAATDAEDPDAEVKRLELLVAELQSKVDILLDQVDKKDAQIDRLIKLLEK